MRSAAALAGVYVALTVLVLADATQALDDAWNDAMIDLETAWLVDVADVLRTLGSTTVAIATALTAVVVFLVARRPWPAAAMATMAVVALAVAEVTKALVDRARPPDPIEVETSASSPSASVMVSATAIAFGLAILLGRELPRLRNALVVAGAAYVVLMAWSRTYLRAHWLTDVTAGAVGGLAVVLGSVWVLSRMRRA